MGVIVWVSREVLSLAAPISCKSYGYGGWGCGIDNWAVHDGALGLVVIGVVAWVCVGGRRFCGFSIDY